MGLKAVKCVGDFFVRVFIIALSSLSIIAFFLIRMSPEIGNFFSVFAIGLPYIIITIFFAFLYSFRSNRWLSVLCFLAIAIHFTYILAVFQPSRSKMLSVEKPLNSFRVLSYNVHGFNHVTNSDYTLEQLALYFKEHQLDFMNFQEFSWNRKSSLEKVKKYLKDYPYSYIPFEKKHTDVAFFSRYPILDKGFIDFEKSYNSGLWVDVDYKGKRIRFFNVHMQTTSISGVQHSLYKEEKNGYIVPQEEKVYKFSKVFIKNSVIRAKQAQRIAAMIKASPYPVILSGDFNDTPASYTYYKLKGNLDDGFMQRGHGLAITYGKNWTFLRIDYTLHSSKLQCSYYDSPKWGWSDHYPVISEFSFKE